MAFFTDCALNDLTIMVIGAQVGENKGRPCEGGGQLKKEESMKGEEEKVLRVSHNLFNTTLRPLVVGLEYQGAAVVVKTLRR